MSLKVTRRDYSGKCPYQMMIIYLVALFFFLKLLSYFRTEFFNWSLKNPRESLLKWFLTWADKSSIRQLISYLLPCNKLPAGQYSGLSSAGLSWSLTLLNWTHWGVCRASWGRLVYKGLGWDNWVDKGLSPCGVYPKPFHMTVSEFQEQ